MLLHSKKRPLLFSGRQLFVVVVVVLLLCVGLSTASNAMGAETTSTSGAESNHNNNPQAERVYYGATTGTTGKKGHGRVQAWDALFRMDYDITLALLLIVAGIVAWGRAVYQHWTVVPKPDQYKTKYH